MSDIVAASPEFRKRIIALLFCTDWMARYGTILRPEYFPTRDERTIVEWVNVYYEEYRDAPDAVAALEKLNDNLVLEEVLSVDDDGLMHAADVALEFAKTQAMKLAVLAAVDDIKAGNLVDIRGRVEEALAVGSDRLDLGWDLIDNVDDWMYSETEGRRFPTGWPTVDSILGGGLVAGEYGLVMAPTGQGKTTALINIGFAMAGLLGSANVLHVTLEMPKQKVLKRYGVRVAGRSFGGDDRGFKDRLMKRAASNMRAHLRVADPDPSVDAIRRLIDNLSSEGFVTEALIVDYADRIAPARRRKELRFELADITQALRLLGRDCDMPVWSATQAGRHALYKEVVTVADIAEAIEKATIADVILALCQTRDEKELGQGRIFGAKMRDSRGGFFVPVMMDFDRQAIVQRGRVSV